MTPAERILAADEALRRRAQRRTLGVVVASQVLGGAGLAAGVTVGALLAQQLVGADALAGLPAALFTLGSAGAAFIVGRISQRRGRRVGLGLGFFAGGLGALGVVVAAAIGSVPLLFVALLVYGADTATNLQARYAGSDLAAPSARGTAVSVALVSTTVGAVAGPNLVAPMGSVAVALGIPALAGPFLLAAAAYLAAGLVLSLLLRPDPLLLARRLAADAEAAAVSAAAAEAAPTADAQNEPTSTPTSPTSHASPTSPASQASPLGRGAIVGAAVMILTQIAMVAIMTMTPVEMRAHHHDLSEVGVVIGIHIAAMYLPSPLTGLLVDRVGRIPMAIAAAVTLLAAGIVGAVAPADSLGLLVLALALLGLGWNFGLISGTALVVDATTPANRARTQGTIDVLIALAGAGGSAMSGVVMASAGYALLSIAGGLLSALLVPVVFWAMRQRGTAQA